MDLTLDGLLLGRLRDALLEAFPTPSALRAFVKIRLNTNLAAVAEGNLSEKAFSLLDEWAEPSGRLGHVLRQARRANPGAPKLLALETELLPSFTTEQLVALEAIWSGAAVVRERLSELASASAPLQWSFPEETESEGVETTFGRLVDSLSLAAKQSGSGLFPLHVFVEHLAREPAGAPLAAQLRDWVAATGGARGAIAGARPSSAPKRLILFLKCDTGDKPALKPEDPVEITGWLWEMGADGQPLDKVPSRKLAPTRCRLDEVPALLTGLRKKKDQLGKLLQEAPMTVELCLRDNLLSEAVDRWMLQMGPDDEEAIGERYPTVVRSFERIYLDEWNVQEHWKPKWDRLKSLPPGQAPPVEWICDRAVSADKAFAKRMRASAAVCAAMAVVPDAKLVSKCVNAGAPVVIWARRGDDPGDTRGKLEAVMAGALADLPARVYEERKRSAGAEDHLGTHLTLLWDDFDRLPPDADDVDFAVPAEG